ncbi:toll/interleukin-1 receptor domain-containing protein [Streptomyces sp. NRRL F-5135]|uniref:toll/interleukin-1 receptor domain-containing protein n=1 Tax=Streptomyces sp. NRRL F-5135 TaxID=1463858 RepID=UPI0004C67B6D|nr:toll/interleukin-1 receptor domain-containing protein [Streptomyces sp. NRRL F-5135]
MTGQPFFFTSYAVRRADSPLVAKFHARLQQEVRIKRGRSAPSDGFLDTVSLKLGSGWRPQLVDALRTTRVLVALLSDDYFDSEWCGREWAVMTERIRRATPPGGPEPVAVLPLFWVPVNRPLPGPVSDLQYRTPRLGDAYADSCLIDVMRGDSRAYHKFVVELTDYMLEISGTPLPELDAAGTGAMAPAFGPVGAPGTPGPTAAGAAGTPGASEVAGTEPAAVGLPQAGAPEARRAGTTGTAVSTVPPGTAVPMSPVEKREFIELLLESDVCRTRDAWDVYMESIHSLIRPERLNALSDGGGVHTRVTALVNAALRRRTPDVLRAVADAFAEQTGEEEARPVRGRVEAAVAKWPAT